MRPHVTGYFDRRQYKPKTKPTEPEEILDKRLYCIVNNNNRLITHEDGHLLLFYRKKDANDWLLLNGDDTWRTRKLDVSITGL